MARVDLVKWIATVIQLIGYGLTGLNIVPWNVFAFIVGIILCMSGHSSRLPADI